MLMTMMMMVLITISGFWLMSVLSAGQKCITEVEKIYKKTFGISNTLKEGDIQTEKRERRERDRPRENEREREERKRDNT